MFRDLVKKAKVDPKECDPKYIGWQVSTWKNRLLLPDDVARAQLVTNDQEDLVLRFYRQYQDLCAEENLVDFDDLLLRPVKFFDQHADHLERYQEKFPFILIDEYQDTNAAQYKLIRLLGGHQNVCATGDPDQAIYGWRGADLNNILDFERDFPGCTTVLLEQNYRSTQTILKAAQSVVENNTQRKDKNIFSENDVGDPIILITVDDEQDEAMGISAAIDTMHREGQALHEIAIFYRANYQSRVLEDWLIRRQIPYRIVGGTRFYDREEVKDLLSYAKLLINPRDLQALYRVINKPRRGIGDKSWQRLRDMAYRQGVSVHEVLMTDLWLDQLAVGRGGSALRSFALLLRQLYALDQSQPAVCLRQILELTGLVDFHLQSDPEKGMDRAGNLHEVITAAEQWIGMDGAVGLEGFLDHISLLTSTDERGNSDEVLLMTLHASKGLEFPVVFITGCEQGILPLVRAGGTPDYEEERRLMYVGITRAMRQLYLSRAVTRSQFGKTQRNPPSMFLAEVPDQCIEHRERLRRAMHWDMSGIDEGPAYPEQSRAYLIGGGEPDPDLDRVDLDKLRGAGFLKTGSAMLDALRSKGSGQGTEHLQAAAKDRDDSFIPLSGDPFKPEDRLSHVVYGPGTVITLKGPPASRNIVILFDEHGQKELALSIAGGRLSRI